MKYTKKFFSLINPPANWLLPVVIISGTLTGLIMLVFHIGNGFSYLSDEPETCINCHVMFSQYSSWEHSSHKRFATCNDCHVPHDNILNKYIFKATDGFRHTSIFTLRLEPQVIIIKNAGKEVVQNNCIRCHSNILSLNHNSQKDGGYLLSKSVYCWKCHVNLPHGMVRSISSVPNVQVPEISPIMPGWLDNLLKKGKKNK